ncbi:MAG: M23 family metallopeptidase, partial [Rickettsiales bacterium]
MRSCLNAIRIFATKSAKWILNAGLALALAGGITHSAYAQSKNQVDKDACTSAWPVSCDAGGGGNTTCGGWDIVSDLSKPELFPQSDIHKIKRANKYTCSTGVRLALKNNENTQGQPVGAMFDGTVIFSQAARSRDGRDYGGVVVIKLDLKDGSPQCFMRYMFLDRRDLVPIDTKVRPGQRIGSVASNSMSATGEWWTDNWGSSKDPARWRPQVKIDIGCDEALVNLPHFMPMEEFDEEMEWDNPENCALTKIRFPVQPLKYLSKTEHGRNLNCDVGVRKDARGGIRSAQAPANRERKEIFGDNFIGGIKPQGAIRRKTTPVLSVYGTPSLRDYLYDANNRRVSRSIVFRDHRSLRESTALKCENMDQLFKGDDDGNAIAPWKVRLLLNHCANQYILGSSMIPKVLEMNTALRSHKVKVNQAPELSPIPKHLYPYMTNKERKAYKKAIKEGATESELYQIFGNIFADDDGDEDEEEEDIEIGEGLDVDLAALSPYNRRVIQRVAWRDQCQPLRMLPVARPTYTVKDILHKSWWDLLIDWPKNNELTPI